MKNFKILALSLLAVGFSFTSCSDDDDDTTTPVAANNNNNAPTQNIAELAIADSRTDSLVVALTQANLVSTFQASGTFTVFAPDNQAFRNLLNDLNVTKIADINNTTLTNILLYHVLGNVVRAGDLTDDTYGTTLNTEGPGGKATVLEIDVTGGAKINNESNITATNIEATNGVIHIIDKVIMPENIVTLAINDERFTSLVAALQVFGDTLTDVLSGTGPFTVFAPTNDAFTDLLNSNPSWNSLSDIPRATLNAVLRYHVVSGLNVQSGDLMQNQSITTFEGSNLTVDLTNGAQLMTASMAQGNVNIIVTDVQGTNGVIHAVDQVLLP